MTLNTITKYTLIALLALGTVNGYCQTETQNKDKTKEQVDALIKETGSTNPAWWDSVELNYPSTLDTSWPVQQGFGRGRGNAGGGRGGFGGRGAAPSNVDQYLSQTVYPNPSLHRQGIKLIDKLTTMHKDDEAKYNRDINVLGQLYYDFELDYARAAYWWQKYSEAGGSTDMLDMARCYYELGSKSAAEEILSKIENSNRDVIKLWAIVGEVDKAIKMIEASANTGRGGGRNNNQQNNDMLAGEIYRLAGKYDEAIASYQKIAGEQSGRGGRGGGLQMRARANIEALKLIKTLDLAKVPDGAYTGSGTGHEGNVTIKATVAGGKIESIVVTQQRETPDRYIRAEQVTRKIVSKQGFEGVDAISAATETSDAIINGAATALARAMKTE